MIGQNGKYVIRLEEKYDVKITFPRDSGENGESKTREALKSDEVLIKGGKKGVASAKAELLDVCYVTCPILIHRADSALFRQLNLRRRITRYSSSPYLRVLSLAFLANPELPSMKSRITPMLKLTSIRVRTMV